MGVVQTPLSRSPAKGVSPERSGPLALRDAPWDTLALNRWRAALRPRRALDQPKSKEPFYCRKCQRLAITKGVWLQRLVTQSGAVLLFNTLRLEESLSHAC